MIYSFSLNGAPKEMQKKIIIFQNFKKYFEEEIKNDKEKEEKEKEEKEDTKIKMCKTSKKKVKRLDKRATQKEDKSKEEENVYVRKWMKTKQAIIFRLSNKTIQVGFKDHTEVILCNDTVNYRNKKGEISIFKIEDALNNSNFEMNKRIKYTQNILTKMINLNLKKNKNE